MGREEELVTGIRKVHKYAKAYGGSEKIEFFEQDVFLTKVPLCKLFFEAGKVSDGINGGTNARKIEDLLLFIKNNPGLNKHRLKL